MDNEKNETGVMKEWREFLENLERELGPSVVQEWVPKVAKFDAANVYLEARDSFQLSWFEEHVRPRLKGFVNCNQRPIKVHLEKKNTPQKHQEAPPLSFTPSPIDPEMALENWIISDQNEVVYKLLEESQDSPKFNPIYLYGPKQSGKTHLLMGTALALQKKGKKVFYTKAERFTEHVVQAMRLGQMREFRKVYRDIDALIIDDIHTFSRKTATQEEFFHTFNTLHTQGRLILISGAVPPAKLEEIEPRLISRFEWGISLRVEKADPTQVLEKKAALWQISLSNELKKMFLEKFKNDPLLALSALLVRSKGAPVTPLVAEKLLKDLLDKENENALTPERIIKFVAAHYGITTEDLLSKSKMKEFALPRQMAMYLCREKLKMPFQAIGRLFDRDHSTVMSSVNQIQQALNDKSLEPIHCF